MILLSRSIGLPVFISVKHRRLEKLGAYNLGGINSSGQVCFLTPWQMTCLTMSVEVPMLHGNWGLIDLDTPKDAYIINSWNDSSQKMRLVFSDEFNVDGRTFYPGDDPYWEAVDLHYWVSEYSWKSQKFLVNPLQQTNNMEWYDPEAITTKSGSLVITLSQKETHNLHYEGGELITWLCSLQS